MEYDSRFDIMSVDFDASVLLCSLYEESLDSVTDRFYCCLFHVASDENVRSSLESVYHSNTVVGRLSHAIYLLPWRCQPLCMLEDPPPAKSTSSSRGHRPSELRSNLQAHVRRAKCEGDSAKWLLNLRLTGYSHVRNLSYDFLRDVCESGIEVTVCLQTSPVCEAARYQGQVLLFDRGSNVLLSKVKVRGRIFAPFMYISGKSIRSISCG